MIRFIKKFFLYGWPIILAPVLTRAFEFDPNSTLIKATELGNNDPGYIIFSTVNIALIFLGTITIIMIVVAGFMWLFAAGVEEKITKAKDLLKGAIFRLLIVLGSYGLARFVFLALRYVTTGS